MTTTNRPREVLAHALGGRRVRWDGHSLLWVALCTATVGMLYSTHFLPLYDYYQWLFQGHVMSVLLFGSAAGPAGPAGPAGVAGSYALAPVPVPNLAAPITIAALDVVLPTEAAGQLFVVLAVLGFAISFGFLVRALQNRPTAIEYLGFAWAPGFFVYKGYLSYLVGLALAFAPIAVLHRAAARPDGPRRGTLWLVDVLAAVLYLSHLLAWVIGVLAVLAHAVVLVRSGRGRRAGLLLATLLPGVVMAGWYVLAEHGGTGTSFYTSWLDKGISLAETLQFFLRLDPFPPVFPIFWVNVVLAVAFTAVVLRHLDRAALRTALARRPVLWLAIALAVIALVTPINTVNDLIKPDERFVLPALMLAVAALPYRALRARTTEFIAVLVAAVLGLHVVEYVDVGHRIREVDRATDAAVPAGAPLLQLAIPSRYGCTPSPGLSIGVPVLKWFGVDHALETGQAHINVDETSIVHATDPDAPGMTVLAAALPEVPALVAPLAAAHPHLEAIGCPSDLTGIEQALTGSYRPISRGAGFTIFRQAG